MTGDLTLPRLALELERFAAGITDDEREAARVCLVDTLACAAAGVATLGWERVAAAVGRSASRPDGRGPDGGRAGVWYGGRSCSPRTATYLNSAAVSAHDLDDGHRGAVGHPGGAVIPAVVALAATVVPAVPILDAVVIGYEAGLRVAEARDLDRVDRTATGRWAAYATAAASCALHGDGSTTVANALAHAASLGPQLVAPDPRAPDGLKEGTPWAAVAGLFAADLARAGVPGPTYALEHSTEHAPAGLDRVAARHPGAVTAIYLKRYACCRWIHPVLDCVEEIRSRAGVDPGRVERVEITTFDRSLLLSNRTDPATAEEAHYSFPWCTALALIDGAGSFVPLDAAALGRPDVAALATRVELRADPGLSARFPAATPAAVAVHLSDGTVERAEAATARGDPDRPLTGAELLEKHDRLMAAVPGATPHLDALRSADLTAVTAGLIAAVTDQKRSPR